MLSKTTKRAKADLSKFLGRGVFSKRPTLRDAIGAFVEYYRQVQYAGCDRADDGDMLLFQYGVHDWVDGAHFELDFTRQFMVGVGAGDSQIEQLHLTFFFEPELGRDLEPFSLWSSDCPDVDDFSSRARKAPVFEVAESQSPARWELFHEVV